MKLTSEEMRRLYQQQTSRSRDGRVDCLSEDVITRAATGELIRSEREMIADHLMVCSDCAEEYRLLRELKPWAEQAVVRARESESSIKPAKVFLDKNDRTVPSRLGWIRQFFGIFSPDIAAYATAAAFLIISLACIAWVISLRRENARITAQMNGQQAASNRASDSLGETRRQIEEAARRAEQKDKEIAELRRSIDDLAQPQINVPIADLEQQANRGSSGSAVATVTVPAGANIFTVILHVSDGPPFADYALEIIDERGQRVGRVQGLRKSEADTFIVALTRRLLPAGRYRLRLFGLRAGKSESIGDYSIRVRYQ